MQLQRISAYKYMELFYSVSQITVPMDIIVGLFASVKLYNQLLAGTCFVFRNHRREHTIW